jgi:hypothetical protein
LNHNFPNQYTLNSPQQEVEVEVVEEVEEVRKEEVVVRKVVEVAVEVLG